MDADAAKGATVRLLGYRLLMSSQLSSSRASATKPLRWNGLAGAGPGTLHPGGHRPFRGHSARSRAAGSHQGRSASLRGGRSQVGRP
jgi:hypothetical protein